MASEQHRATRGSGGESDFATGIQDDYILRRDAAASARLSLSHYLWHKSFGFNLHPRIAGIIKKKEHAAIADVGSGTGIWLLDVAQELPQSCHLDAMDISFDQFPPTEWLPKNVSRIPMNALGEVPEDFVERYDVIHMRHFACVVKDDDPTTLLQNLLRMLRPGGWLQWDEWEQVDINPIKARQDTPQENLDKLGQEIGQLRRHTANPTWCSRLDEYFSGANMRNIILEKTQSAPSHLLYLQDNNILAFQELIDGAEAMGRIDAEKAKYLRRILSEATKESKMGFAWDLTRCMSVGQKPMNGEQTLTD